MKRLWQRPLARELIIVLVVKLALIISIKIVFYASWAYRMMAGKVTAQFIETHDKAAY